MVFTTTEAGYLQSSAIPSSLRLHIPTGSSSERYQPCNVASDDIVFLNSPQGATPASQYPNRPLFPRDVSSHIDDESVWEEDDVPSPSMPLLDPVVIDIGFDCSCLDDLDEKLLLTPIDSFADICWADAVYDDRTPRGTRWRPTHAMPNLGLIRSSDTESSDDDSVTCHGSPTFTDLGKVVDHSASIEVFHTHGPSKDRALYAAGHHFDDDGENSLIWSEPQFGTSGPKDSIGFFPIARQNIPKKPTSRGIERIMTMCSNLIKLPS
ncbi:hypothetical protein ONZ45_g17397 [Pleurotus djamor]|nr:hypothetical protein ONZ45_g17397 [Pleurotus djamor]